MLTIRLHKKLLYLYILTSTIKYHQADSFGGLKCEIEDFELPHLIKIRLIKKFKYGYAKSSFSINQSNQKLEETSSSHHYPLSPL